MWVSKFSDKWMALREFLGAFIMDKSLNRQGILFYNANTGKNLDSVLMENYWRMYKAKQWKKIQIRLKGIAKEMISDQIIEFEYPSLEQWDDVTKYFTDHVLLWWAIKSNFVDDEMVLLFRNIVLQNFKVYYQERWHYIWLQPKTKVLDLSIWLEELLDKEIEQWYYNKIIWDKQRRYWYTHILRRNAQMNLQTWQKTVLYNWKQFNFVAWARRIWKTFMSAMIAYREIYKLWGWYGARDRQILYVTVTDDKSWQPFQYLKLLMKKDIELWYIKVSWKEFTNTITNAKLIFVTAWSKSWARSFGADLVIIDEAAEIADDYWTDLLPIIMQEKATVYAISTINEDSQNGWFYRELVRWELTWRDDYNSIRVTIDDNELLDDKTREDAKAKIMEVSQIKYWTELYCIFPSSNSVFKMSWIIQPALEELSKSFVIWYDPWKINDDAWLVVVDMQNLRVIEELPLKYMQYKDQKKVVADLKEKYKATVVLDRTWVWEAVFEIVQDCIDVSVKYKKSWWEISYNKEHNYYNVPKKDLVETMQLYIESYWLKINSWVEQLITQMKWFKKFNSWSYITYCWVWVKDDLVNALLLCWFYMKHIRWLNWKNQIVEQQWVWRILDNFNWQDWFDEYTWDDNFKKYIY